MLLLFTLALSWSDRRPILAGAALGLAFNIKYMPITLLPYLLLRRRWRMAGAFVASIAFFALIPALSMGWTANLGALATAYGGVAKLLSLPIHRITLAHLVPMDDIRSISLPSGIARLTGWPDGSALAASATLGLLFMALAAHAYERAGLPILRWPAATKQASTPLSTLFAVEYVTIILLTLIFSPFANTAHLYLLVLINAAAAAWLISLPPGSNRWPLVVGMAAMYIGITWPPGGDRFRAAETAAKWISVPAWCMLLNGAMLLGTAVRALARPVGQTQTSAGFVTPVLLPASTLDAMLLASRSPRQPATT